MNVNDAVPVIKLSESFLVPLDRLPEDLRRRWDVCQSKLANGENVKGTIATLLREIEGVVGVDVLLRASHRAPQSALGIGMAEKDATAHGATFRSLSATAAEQRDGENKREGVKPSAGKTRCPLCGK